MITSPSTAQLDEVMAKVQQELRPVRKNKTVEVDGARANWKSRYATLTVLHDASHEILTRHGIVIYQGGKHIPGGGERLETRLSYKGEFIESDFPVKTSRDGAQGFGGGISFARRWGLCSMVGLVTQDDVEEEQGYRDERAAKPAKQKAPPGIADLIGSIRNAATLDELATASTEGRSAHSVGEPAASVERAIAEWFIAEFNAAKSLDSVTLLRDGCSRVKPRGNSVHAAIREAEKRLMP